jgi:hypothetical protein
MSVHEKAISDFIRCENLALSLAAIRQRLDATGAASPLWTMLVTHWDDAVQLLEAEYRGAIHTYSGDLRSTDTYRLVRSLIEEKS